MASIDRDHPSGERGPVSSPAPPGREDEPDGGAAEALERFEETQRGARHLTGWAHGLAAILAGGWSLFQLSLPKFVFLDAAYIRSIHLAFAIALVYLSFPALRRVRLPWPLHGLSARQRLPWFDIVLAVVAAGVAMYLMFDYEGIASRSGRALPRDIVVGCALIVLLLEAARRAFGPTLSVVAALFLAYGFVSESMPGVLQKGNVSLKEVVSQLTLSTEGIYGIPIYVSATTVFLFVLFGAMLEKSGGGRYFVQLAFSLLGRYKGGPAKAAVTASGLTGMISGSSIANVVTTGTFTIPLMKRSGYPAEKAAAIEVAASTNGQLMPPIMGAAAFIIAEYCGVPYLDVVRAAFVPAVVSYLALIYITHIEACKLGLKGVARAELPRFGETLLGGLHFMLPLVMLIWMLLRGFTPHMSVFYAILVLAGLIVAQRVIHVRRRGGGLGLGLWRGVVLVGESLVTGGRNMMGVAIACATAGIIVGVVNMGLGPKVAALVEIYSAGNVVLLLMLTAFASLVLGMGLPTTATYIVMASLVADVIVRLGGEMGVEINKLAAHLFCFFFGILADDTPPVGLAAYAGAAIARANAIRTGVQGFLYDLRTAILPFMFVFNADLLLTDVHGVWHIAVVFTGTAIALCAFAALTQNYMTTRNRLHESVLLLLCAAVALRPRWPGDMLASWGVLDGLGGGLSTVLTSKFTWYGVGASLFGVVWLLQRPRAKRAARSTAMSA